MRKTLTLVVFALMAFAVSAKSAVNQFSYSAQHIFSEGIENLNNETDSLVINPSTIVDDQTTALLDLRIDSLIPRIPFIQNDYIQHYIDIYSGQRTQIGKMLGLSKYYFPIFERALINAGLPIELKYLTIVESKLDPQAVSRSGAVGPWQFMYATAKGYGLVMDSYVDERKDPVKASIAAAHYLQNAYDRLGDWLLAIASYNCGMGAVSRAIERSGGVVDFWQVRPFLPKETQNYVPAFLATIQVMNNYEKLGITEIPANFNVFTDALEINKTISISAIAKATELDEKELIYLNPSYKKRIVNGTEQAPKTLVIPKLEGARYTALYDVLNGSSPELPVVAASENTRSEKNIIHKVRPGQNLSQIANSYGVEVQDLKVWNNLKSTTIVPGQSIQVFSNATPQKQKSTPEFITYIVKAGDTLSEIAEKFNGVTVSNIKAWNGLSKSVLRPGMNLRINKG